MEITWEPGDHPLAPLLAPLAAEATRRLELAGHVAGLTICLDDIAPDERIWVTSAPRAAADREERPHLTLYFHPDHFVKDHAPELAVPAGLRPWELRVPPPAAPPAGAAAFSARKAERILYHQFLLVRDLCAGQVDPRRVPPALAEAFQEAWAVTLDGRLRRAMLPGYSQAERRRRFFRVFSAGGVLLPQHWQIFHALWEWESLDQAALLELLGRLPALRGARRAESG